MINIHINGIEIERIHELLKTSMNYDVKFEVNQDKESDKVIHVYDSWDESPMEIDNQINICIVSLKTRPRNVCFNLLKQIPEVFCIDYKIFIKKT